MFLCTCQTDIGKKERISDKYCLRLLLFFNICTQYQLAVALCYEMLERELHSVQSGFEIFQ